MAKECKIVVVDDHTLFRNGLRTLLDGIEGFFGDRGGVQRCGIVGIITRHRTRRDFA